MVLGLGRRRTLILELRVETSRRIGRDDSSGVAPGALIILRNFGGSYRTIYHGTHRRSFRIFRIPYS